MLLCTCKDTPHFGPEAHHAHINGANCTAVCMHRHTALWPRSTGGNTSKTCATPTRATSSAWSGCGRERIACSGALLRRTSCLLSTPLARCIRKYHSRHATLRCIRCFRRGVRGCGGAVFLCNVHAKPISRRVAHRHA